MFNATSGFSSFSVKDIDVAKDFYTETLGLKVGEDEMGLRLRLPNGPEVFIYQKDNHTPATYTVLNLVVADIDEALEALVEKGVEFEQYDMPDFKQDEKGVARGLEAGQGPDIAWFKDPSDNIFSILQEK